MTGSEVPGDVAGGRDGMSDNLLLFCCGCFASNEDGSWGHTCDENYCYNCGHGPIIQIPRHAVESIRQQASWVGKRYYPHDEDTEIATELQALRSLRERLMVALARYELDEPHWVDGPLSPDECDHLTAEKLAEWLEREHDGDCTGEAHTCARCLAEHWRHKADWIASLVAPPQTPAPQGSVAGSMKEQAEQVAREIVKRVIRECEKAEGFQPGDLTLWDVPVRELVAFAAERIEALYSNCTTTES